jgi:signal peptidase I
MMILNWLLSGTVRQATSMSKHVRRLLAHQRDILQPAALQQIQAAIQQMQDTLAGDADKTAIKKQMETLEKTANECFIPYPNPAWRENIEVLLVALAVAMAIRTFFVQPFKIPTGSMQPTLYGVTSENLVNQPDFKIPTGWQRVKEWFAGASYVHVVAAADGEFQGVTEPVRLLIFNIKQSLWVGGRPYTIWFPPDFGAPPNGSLPVRAELRPGQMFHKGDDIVRLRVNAGDHLFVDRVTYNFRPPNRGEIIVFETHGINRLAPEQQDTFYIKRLVGLGGDTLVLHGIGEVTDVPGFGSVPVGTLVANGRPLTAATPHFENLYGSPGTREVSTIQPYKENRYYGHGMIGALAPGQEYEIRPDHLFVMGDNTMNSLDSRYWGDFSANNVIGRSFFVYWPITDRFGASSINH